MKVLQNYLTKRQTVHFANSLFKKSIYHSIHHLLLTNLRLNVVRALDYMSETSSTNFELNPFLVDNFWQLAVAIFFGLGRVYATAICYLLLKNLFEFDRFTLLFIIYTFPDPFPRFYDYEHSSDLPLPTHMGAGGKCGRGRGYEHVVPSVGKIYIMFLFLCFPL